MQSYMAVLITILVKTTQTGADTNTATNTNVLCQIQYRGIKCINNHSYSYSKTVSALVPPTNLGKISCYYCMKRTNKKYSTT